MTRFLGLLLFLVYCDDYGLPFAQYLGTPFGWVHGLLLEATPIKLRPFDLILIVLLIVSSSKRSKSGGMVPPMKNSLFLVIGAVVTWVTYGLVKGGDFRNASWQTYLILSTVLVAFTVASVCRTPADFGSLAKWLIASALYRALMCWLSFFTWAIRPLGLAGAFLTSHDDTIGWVVAILILIVNTLDARRLVVTLRNVAMIGFILVAIQFNTRRLAWVSLAMGLIVLYALFPEGTAKRRVKRTAMYLAPVVAIYTVVGWGSESAVFLPLRALSSVSTKEDSSTLARNAENLGLIKTSVSSSLLMGTGWGRPYTPVSMKYDISSAFDLWQYVPHNSILGVLAFTGVLGFAGFWLVLPTAVFMNARLARLASDPKARSVGLIGAAQLIVVANQLYGDMGIFFVKPMYTLAISYAIALRLPRTYGVWNAPKVAAPAAAAKS